MDVGVVIGKYKIVEHIGRGGMADVWSARDQDLNRMVAIKTIAHGLSQNVDPISLFRGEAQTIAQMEHPNILPIYDYGEFEGQLYIVMRYVSGGSLEDRLNRGPIPLNEALRFGQAVAQALDYAHDSNVIHLDLKPPNVLLDSHASPYLADFGLATKLNREGKAHNPGSGTLLYMAPEQLTAEVLDHRADLYSFGVMMFHLLTGQLPFDGSMPLALKQLQFHEALPEVDDVKDDLPPTFTDILRRATAVDPNERYSKLMDIVDEMREALLDSSTSYMFADAADPVDAQIAETYRKLAEAMPDSSLDPEVLEALDIYSRAYHHWSGGNGRFLLGVTHFMLMNGFYMYASDYKLELDTPGKQMLLRGALEYNIELDYWWGQLDDDNRRWVCLHALRSGNAPARIRALERLETIPDSSSPQIPKLVAQALQIETDKEARLAALKVMGTRAKLVKRDKYNIQTEYRNRVLTSMTRLGVQVSSDQEWIEVVYTPEIDLLIAELAFEDTMPEVAEYAARIIGRMRSITSVRYILKQRKQGRKGALRALALIRDETPTLPKEVSFLGRIYAWGSNTIRRMFENPMGLVYRYLGALIGAWVGMGGFYIWSTFRSEQLFTSARWGASLGMGLVFAVFIGFVVLFAGEFSSRLRQFWPWWGRLLLSSVAGVLLASLAYNQFTWFYLNYTPDQDIMYFGGAGLALGLVVTALFNLPGWAAVLLTTVFTYIPLWATWEFYWNYTPELPLTQLPILYFVDNPSQVASLGIPLAFMIAVGAHLPSFSRDIVALIKRVMSSRAKRVEVVKDAAVSVPNVREYIQEPTAMETELDANNKLVGFYPSQFATKRFPDNPNREAIEAELSQTKSSRVVLGKKPDVPATEIDPQTSHDELSQTKSSRLSLGKKATSAPTELDANQGIQSARHETTTDTDALNQIQDEMLQTKSSRLSLGKKATPAPKEADLNAAAKGDNDHVTVTDAEDVTETRSTRLKLGKKPAPASTELDLNQGLQAEVKPEISEEESTVVIPNPLAAHKPTTDLPTELDIRRPTVPESDPEATQSAEKHTTNEMNPIRTPRFLSNAQNQDDKPDTASRRIDLKPSDEGE